MIVLWVYHGLRRRTTIVGREKASDDKSGYVSGKGAEFAFSFDADFDGGQTRLFRLSCLYPDLKNWNLPAGTGKLVTVRRWDPQKYWNLGNKNTANEKYWLLIGKQPNDSKYAPLRIPPQSEGESYTYIQDEAKDTRYLFAFYGHGTGISELMIQN